jgi:hypothetical protein
MLFFAGKINKRYWIAQVFSLIYHYLCGMNFNETDFNKLKKYYGNERQG